MATARIYIVEDSAIVCFHLQRTLESEGYTVLGTADSGEKALTEILELQPDLVLMDIMLSGPLDGIDTATRIKQETGTPVIYLTALTDKATIQRAKITEPYGYLTKPFEDLEIFTVIEMALYKHSIEKKLRQSEERFFSTLKSISDAVITIDNQYYVSYLNPSAESILGVPAREAMSRSIFEVLRLKDKVTGAFPVNPIQSELTPGLNNSWPGNLYIQSKDGREIPVMDGVVSPVIDSRDQAIGLVITFKDGTDKLESKRLLEESERSRLAALMEGQEKERRRIAKDLHDGLGQMLNAIKMNFNTSISDASKTNYLFQLLDDAILETKRISENLLPSKLRDFDLATCLKSLCSQLQQGVTTNISFSAYTHPLPLNETKKINLYRIAQEALNNSIRHSRASAISVLLNEDQDAVNLTIEDDGIGLNKMTNRVGNGLINIEDRTKIMNGQCTIESDTRRGTIIIVEVPR